MNRSTPDGPEVQVVVDEARRVLAQLGPDRAGGVANLLREIIAQGRDARVVLVDSRDPSRWIQRASLEQIGAPAEVRVQRTMQVLDRWRDVREKITVPGHYLAAFFDQVADATGGDGLDAAAGRPVDPRAHAGLGLPCEVCPGACTIDDPPAGPQDCDGGAVGGPFPTACGRDVVHPAHPLGRRPVAPAAVVGEARAQIEEALEAAGRHGLTAAELAERLDVLVDQLPMPLADLLTDMYSGGLILAGGLPIHDRVVLQATGVQCRDCEESGRNCGPHRTYEQRRRDCW